MSNPVFYIPANNVSTTVVGSYTALSRTLNVLDGSGLNPTLSRPVRATVIRQSDSAFVIYKVSASVNMGSFYQLTVDPIEGTTDLNFVNNDRLQMRITAGAIEDLNSAVTSLYTSFQSNFGPQGTTGATGATGVQGNTGVQGSAGTGAQGVTGLQGTQGTTGNGPQGAQGLTGAGTQGVQGFQGVIGVQGLRGFQGWQGFTGVGTQGTQGGQGVQGAFGGPQGDLGVQGIQGFQGINGLPGGPQGLQGLQGVQGIQGVQGFGLQGVQGIQGTQGVQGQGTQGTHGNIGIQGFQGIQGVQGIIGLTGGMAIGGGVSGGTSGSVLFVSSGGTLGQDNSHFYWDPTQQQLAIGTNSLTGFVTLVNSKPSNPCLVMLAASGQTADLLRIQNSSASTTYMLLDSAGRLGVGQGPDATAHAIIRADTSYGGLIVRNTSNVTSPLQIQNSGSENLVHIGSTGNLFVGSPALGIASDMGTLHISHNNNIGGTAFIVAQQNTVSPAAGNSYFEARDTTGATQGVWDFAANMTLGTTASIVNTGSRLTILGSSALSKPAISVQLNASSFGPTNPFLVCCDATGAIVSFINFRGDIEPGAAGIRFGFTPGNNGKIAFYNSAPIVQPNGSTGSYGDMRGALIGLGLIDSSVGFPSTIVTNPFTESGSPQTYTVVTNDNVILCENTGLGTFILPSSSTWQHRYLIFKRYAGSDTFGGTGDITLSPGLGDSVEGGNSISVDTPVARYLCVGTQWLQM